MLKSAETSAFLRGQRGAMLIEALIGTLIFFIGILALLGMQATAIKNTTDARYRSQAAYLANSIVSQIRVDMANIGSYDDAQGAAYAPRTAWRDQVAAALPGVSIATATRVPSIAIVAGPTYAGDPTPSSRVTVTVNWMQPGESVQRQFQIVSHVSR